MRFLVSGGAGFIGSTLIQDLLQDEKIEVEQIVVIDNFSSGTRGHLAPIAHDRRLTVVEGDLKDQTLLDSACEGVDTIFHFASNADIAKAAIDPTVDFQEGTLLTQNLLEAARINEVTTFVYASGSGVYGNFPNERLSEDHGPLEPISPYGASKLAGEALLSAYSHMFSIGGRSLRFANVIGPNQTHGVTFDFVNRLKREPDRLEVLGDGSQTKPYIYISDIVRALRIALSDALLNRAYRVFNASTDEGISVREIAEICISKMGLQGVTQISYGELPRGWAGDVPVVSMDSRRLKNVGWKPTYNSREAIERAISGYLDLLENSGSVR
jgi:UDP-glucose 4-epimerase